jgi:predicted amidohydrolase
MKIGIVSLEQVWENKEENKSLCKKEVEKAVEANLDLIIFPEMTLTGFSMDPLKISEELKTSPTIEFFKTLATNYKIGIVFGVCLIEPIGNTNCAIYVSNIGIVEAIYRKTHPFTFAQEDKHFSPGNEIVMFQLNGFNIGLSICYDLRFPELYRLYTDSCQMVINIANWPERRVDHWNTLLKARAIENQYVVVGVNRTGMDGNQLKYKESSNVYLPDGNNPELLFVNNALKAFELDSDVVTNYRESFPVIQDRRKDLYKKLEDHARK